MNPWSHNMHIFFLLVMNWLVASRGQQFIGNKCDSGDRTEGVCRDIKQCVDSDSHVQSAKSLKLCPSTSLNTIVACCRKTAASIARAKCEEWKRLANANGNPCTTSIPLVRGGEEADVGEFPHIVSLIIPNQNSRFIKEKYLPICGGVLISEKFVLTAAHCVKAANLVRDLFVHIGGHDLTSPEDVTVEPRVIDILIHPEYDEPRKYNDIALLKLATDVNFSKRIQPACLPYQKRRVVSGTKLVVAGWGLVKDGAPASVFLQKVEITAIDRFRCDNSPIISEFQTLLEYPAGITDSLICTDESRGGACKGDSGGPLMRATNSPTCEPREVVGLASRGINSCSSTNVPGTYTNIEYYLDWIVKTVWPESFT